MEVRDISVHDLIEYDNNPRNNDGAVDAVAESIREFGFKVPIVVDRDNVIVAGHTRLKAAKKLGLETVPCVIADDLSPEQVRAYRLADNKVGELAEWDEDKLADEYARIENIDLGLFGFEDVERKDVSEFFEDAEPKEKEPKTAKCPHCGAVNTID